MLFQSLSAWWTLSEEFKSLKACFFIIFVFIITVPTLPTLLIINICPLNIMIKKYEMSSQIIISQARGEVHLSVSIHVHWTKV